MKYNYNLSKGETFFIETASQNNSKIIFTNYFESKFSREAKFYPLYLNGRLNIFLSDKTYDYLVDKEHINKVSEIIVSFGLYVTAGAFGYELMFEDHSDMPFALYTTIPTGMPAIPVSKRMDCFIITPSGVKQRYIVRSRHLSTLPNASPWSNSDIKFKLEIQDIFI